MRPRGSADLIADRRRRALALVDDGLSLNEVARRIGCQASSVMRWRDSRRRHGAAVFSVRFSPGRPPKLSAKQRGQLGKLLLKGAMANGFRTELWTTARVAQVIRQRFGVNYHRDHVGRLLAKMGWSAQKPERRALERNEARIQQWKEGEWPRIKKTLSGWAPTLSSLTNPGF